MASRKCLHGIGRIKFGKSVILRFEAALQEKITEAFHQFVEVDDVRRFTYVFAVFSDFHAWPSDYFPFTGKTPTACSSGLIDPLQL